MLRQGAEPRGIVAAGHTLSEPERSENTDSHSLYCDIAITSVVDDRFGHILSIDEMRQSLPLADVPWNLPSGGMEFSASQGDALEFLWVDLLARLGHRELSVPTPESLDLSGLDQVPARRVPATGSRIIRDTRLAKRVKDLHNNQCQICGHCIRLSDGSGYAEGHHIQPLGAPHHGPDVIANILCLCPNHHVECDFGAIELKLSDLRQSEGHSVSSDYIDYHNRKIRIIPNAG